MTEKTFEHDDEISLLDILVTLAESWKLLVFGPLIAGVLAGALSFLWPKTYESVAIVRMNEAELALLNSAPVLDPLIEKFGLLPEFDGIQEDARQYLAKKLVGKVDKKTGLATITAAANTPERAQELGKAAMDALLKELLPKGKNKDQVEQQILSNERIIASSADAIEQLQKQIGKAGQNDAGLEVVMKYYASLNADVAKKELENIELKKSLAVRGDEVYVQQASLPQRKVSPKRSLVVLLSVLASGFALLMFVFVRKAWQSAIEHARVEFVGLAIHIEEGARKMRPHQGHPEPHRVAEQLDLDRLRHGGKIADQVFHELRGLDFDPGHLRLDLARDLGHHLLDITPPAVGVEADEVVAFVGFGQPATQLHAGAARIAGHLGGFADDLLDLTQQPVSVAQRGARLGLVVQNEAAFVHLGHEARLDLAPGHAANSQQDQRNHADEMLGPPERADGTLFVALDQTFHEAIGLVGHQCLAFVHVIHHVQLGQLLMADLGRH